MAEPLKNIYNRNFVAHLCAHCEAVIPDFNRNSFLKSVFNKQWKQLELKARIRQLSTSLIKELQTKSVEEQIKTVAHLADHIQKKTGKTDQFEYMFLPDCIEVLGTKHKKEALKALKRITVLSSCEFAIRPFLIDDPIGTLSVLLQWSKDSHPSVRRLASEGCRPMLPWAMALPQFKKDPTPLLPILENLKADTSLFVRKSVANNLNDISKHQPEILLEVLKKWRGKNQDTDWILKHASRTLLKQGHPVVLKAFGLNPNAKIALKALDLGTGKTRIGEKLWFKGHLINQEKGEQHLRLEYFIYFLRKGNKTSKKVFKISERKLSAGEEVLFEKTHDFRRITTRVYYPGKHKLSIVINGKEHEPIDFQLNE